jgi:hypothetical protein
MKNDDDDSSSDESVGSDVFFLIIKLTRRTNFSNLFLE